MTVDSGIFPTQASELSNVIGSSPVSSGTVQALGDGHDSAAVGSTSTSSPLQALEDDSAAVGSTSISSPLQALGDGHDSAAVGSTSISSPLQALGDGHDSAAVGSTSTSSPLQALGDDSAAVGSTSTSSPLQALGDGDDSAAVGSTSTSSPLQVLRDDSAAVGSTSTSSPLQALGDGDDSAAVGSTSTSSPLQALGDGDDSVAVSSTSTSSPSQVLRDDSATAGLISTSSPVQSSSPTLFESPLPSFQSPVQDSSGCCASETPFGFSPAVTSISSAPTQAFGPTASGFGTFAAAPTPSRFASMQDPVKASGPSQNLCKPASSPLFGRPDIGFSPASSSSTTTVFGVLFGTTPGSVSSPFGPTQASTSTFLPFGGVPASSLCNSVFGCPPASSSSNLFRPNPSTNASVSSPFGFSPSVTSVSSSPTQTFGPKAVFSVSTASPSIFASPSVPDHSQKTSFATTQGNFLSPGFGCGFSPAAASDATTFRYGGFIPDPPSASHAGFGCGFSPAAVSGATTFPSGGFGQPNAPSASHDWSRRTEQGSRFPGCAPTPGAVSLSTLFPRAFSSFSPSFPAVSSSVQRPHEAAAVSSPPFGCTACGATSSSSASPNFTFNGATSLPVLFYPTFGFGTSSAAQVTSPAPVQGYILLPFAAMSLQ